MIGVLLVNLGHPHDARIGERHRSVPIFVVQLQGAEVGLLRCDRDRQAREILSEQANSDRSVRPAGSLRDIVRWSGLLLETGALRRPRRAATFAVTILSKVDGQDRDYFRADELLPAQSQIVWLPSEPRLCARRLHAKLRRRKGRQA